LGSLLDLGKLAVEYWREILFAGEKVQRCCLSAGLEGVVSLDLDAGVFVLVGWATTVSATVADS